MADVKITALTAISSNPVNPATFPIPMVDLLDNTITASGTTKKVTVNQILGAGGTATLASATITGAATVGTTLGVTGNLTVLSTGLIVNTTGVGVGVTPTNNLHVKGASGTTTIKIEAVTDGNIGFIGSASGMISGSPANNLAIRAENGLYLSGNGNATQFILNSAGNVTVSNGNVIFGTSGKGIDFSAVTGGTGTATANVLNDYEEGTFTPTMLGTTGSGTGTPYGAQVGRYTKVGNLVTVSAYLDWTAHTATGNMRLGGLPFATNATSNSISSVTFGYVTNIALTALNLLTGYTSTGNAFIDLYQTPTGGGASTAVPVDTAAGVGYTVTYRV